MRNERNFQDILNRVNATFKPRGLTLVFFLVSMLLVKISDFAYFIDKINWLIVGVIIWLISSFFFKFLIQKQTTSLAVIRLYLVYTVFVEIPILTVMIYSVGGVEWAGAIFFLFPVVYISIVLSRTSAFFVASVASVFYLLLVLLPYFNIVPFQPFFDLGFNLYQQSNYVIINLLFVTATFYLIAYAAGLFTGLLKKRAIDLEKAETALKKEKIALEERVRERTKELGEFSKNLEEKVEERTREAQAKIKELERFNELVVGREMKMIELKNKIKEFEEKLNKGDNLT